MIGDLPSPLRHRLALFLFAQKNEPALAFLSSSSFNLMADPRPPHSVSSHESEGYNDPFADRPGRTRFVEPEIPRSPSLRAYDSVTNLQTEGQYEDDEYIEKQPLTQAHGFYPPRQVCERPSQVSASLSASQLNPDMYGDPYGDSRPISIASTSTSGVESGWRRRQTIKRGVTRKVKLTQGNFIAEYPVPTPVVSAIEAKYTSTKSTEFS